MAFEHELTLSEENDSIAGLSFALRAQRPQNEFASWLISAPQIVNVQPEMFLPEFSQNHYEITCNPLVGADRAVNIRQITHEIARQMNLNVTFSPLAPVNAVSNGVHVHLSVQDLNRKSLFYVLTIY